MAQDGFFVCDAHFTVLSVRLVSLLHPKRNPLRLGTPLLAEKSHPASMRVSSGHNAYGVIVTCPMVLAKVIHVCPGFNPIGALLASPNTN